MSDGRRARPRRGADPMTRANVRELFAAAYLASNWNGPEAARQVLGAKGPRAYSEARRFLAEPEVQRLIDKAVKKIARPLEVRAAEVAAAYVGLLRFNPKALHGEGGGLLPVGEMADEDAQCLEGVEVVETAGKHGAARTTKVRYVRRAAVVDMGLRICGLYAKDNAQRAADPDEQARMIRERLGQIEELTAPAKAARSLGRIPTKEAAR